MLLMSAFSLGMIFLIPKMKDAITDPEIIKEIEERKKKGESNPTMELPDITGNLADFFANAAVKQKKD